MLLSVTLQNKMRYIRFGGYVRSIDSRLIDTYVRMYVCMHYPVLRTRRRIVVTAQDRRAIPDITI